MIKKLLIVASVCGLLSCSNVESIQNLPQNSDIRGFATPIQLTSEKTEINLEDYFLDVNRIDSLKALPVFQIVLFQDKKLAKIQYETDKTPLLSEMKVWVKGTSYSLLLKKSKKLKADFSFNPKLKKYKSVQIKGQMNDWNPSRSPLELRDGRYQTSMWLNPGKYQYLFVVDGKEMLDPENPMAEDNNIGGRNSIAFVGQNVDSLKPSLVTKEIGEEFTIGVANKVDEIFVFWENFRLGNTFVSNDGSKVHIKIPTNAKLMKRSNIRIWAFNKYGCSNDVLVPLDYGVVLTQATQLDRSDKQAQILYFLMVDRFFDGSTSNNKPVNDPEILPKANYFGGDIAGVTQKLKEGYFDSLGINTIWLSPITQNPLGAWGLYNDPKTKFSGYHGYWPTSLSKVDFRFGTSDELHNLINLAHNKGMNIILDYVAHHIHIEHPAWKEHPDWFTSLYLPDGTLNTEKWDEYRLTTWFDSFLPTLALDKPEVYEPMSDSALYWIKNYDIDGFRHDATKHIPEPFWRRLTQKIKQQLPANKSVFQIGETYGSRELINSYIGSGMMDSQFDFNVYDDAIAVFAKPNVSFSKLDSSLLESLDYYGYHNLMGNISGNQDRARFVSYAGGSLKFDENAKKAGWKRDIEVGDAVGYKRLSMLNVFNMTIPGVPTIYYGDEFGSPGGNDPDNRRLMKFAGLNVDEKNTINITKKIVNIRKNNLALIFGDFKTLFAEQDIFAFARGYFSNRVIVVFNKSKQTKEVELILPKEYQGKEFTASFSSNFTINGNRLTLTLADNSFDILIAKN
ncbi:MAG: alpha-amylase [Bacteroidales bacterium]|nr:alpha-amylase [Bacteroidales bacterium]